MTEPVVTKMPLQSKRILPKPFGRNASRTFFLSLHRFLPTPWAKAVSNQVLPTAVILFFN
jgi:hypothetical protein